MYNNIKKLVVLILVVLTIFLFKFVVFADENGQNVPVQEQLIQIPGNTQITVRPENEIVGNQFKKGDFLNFLITDDLVVNGQIVVKKDSIAKGEITDLVHKALGGKAASIEIKILNITTVDNQVITVIGSFSTTGSANYAGIVPLFGAFAKGHDVIIPVTQEIKVLIPNTVTVKLNK